MTATTDIASGLLGPMDTHTVDVTRFTDQIKPEHRYASFDYCFNYFQSHRGDPRSLVGDNLQTSCLQLGFYLASWGMVRGSSFLLQRSVKHFEPVLEVIALTDREFWRIDLHSYDEEMIDEVLRVAEELREALSLSLSLSPSGGTPSVSGAQARRASDTLVTKVMLGVFGCVPAFDQYFRAGFKVGRLNRNALEKIADYYQGNHEHIDALRRQTIDFETGQPTQFRYTRAKVIDMQFFVLGFPVRS